MRWFSVLYPAAVEFTKNLIFSNELLARQITVNAIAPGPMDTPFFYSQETKESTSFHKAQAMGDQLTKIEDIVPIIKFLTTAGWWINGQTIFANGGYTTR